MMRYIIMPWRSSCFFFKSCDYDDTADGRNSICPRIRIKATSSTGNLAQLGRAAICYDELCTCLIICVCSEVYPACEICKMNYSYSLRSGHIWSTLESRKSLFPFSQASIFWGRSRTVTLRLNGWSVGPGAAIFASGVGIHVGEPPGW